MKYKYKCSLCKEENKYCKMVCEYDHLYCAGCYRYVKDKDYVLCPLCVIKDKKSTLFAKCYACDWKDNIVLQEYHIAIKHTTI